MSGAMDLAQIAQNLAQAEMHVASGERHISQQRAIIDELERGGHDATEAKALLVGFEQTQRLHLENRDRLRQELKKASSG